MFIPFFLMTLYSSVLFPSLRLLFFAPYLILFLYKNNLSKSLWMAFCCGLILDLLTTGNRVGLFALNFTLTLLFLYRLKSYFFRDRLSTLPIMTFLFSATAAFLQLFLEGIFQGATALHISRQWLLSDLIQAPFCDAFFALILLLISKAASLRFKVRSET